MRQKTDEGKRNRAPLWHLMRLKSSTYEDHSAKSFEAPKNGIQDSPSFHMMFFCLNVPSILFSMCNILNWKLRQKLSTGYQHILLATSLNPSDNSSKHAQSLTPQEVHHTLIVNKAKSSNRPPPATSPTSLHTV